MRDSRRLARPRTIAEAIDLLEQHGDEAKVLAGGTALTIMLRAGLIDPSLVVALVDIPELDGLRATEGELEIGALRTHRSVARSDLIRDTVPVLADAFGKVGNVRVRNAATVGGVVAEADYASDPPAVLRGLDASIVVAGSSGERTIPADQFFVGFYETACGPAEVVTGVRIPIPPPATAAAYERFTTRSAEDRPCVGVFASCGRLADGSFGDIRVSVGAAAETPQRFPDLEEAANGTDLGDDAVDALAEGYAERIETLDDVRGSSSYRTKMIRVHVRRALRRARAAAMVA